MIINSSIQGVSGVYSNAGRVGKTARAYEQGGAVNDNIQISTEGQQFNELLKKLKAGSEVRMDKVTEYENLLASGAYQVSSSDLADKILQSRY
ncbi:MAG: flagellar biosynthesis anti-sigma factor FlgM [Anaerovibrio sp.]|nr:flagellar biosynthesis anti-sigma factor FlgM [Anaerovibrio sp.]